jgi:ABC-2 type transport system permease protein
MFIFIFAFPLIITLVIRLVFGGLFDQAPRLGVVDLGSSSIPAAVAEMDSVAMTRVSSVDELRRMVRAHDLDAGLILPEGFDESVRSGARPELQFFLSGESLASDRIILTVTAVDLVRQVAGAPSPVHVTTEMVGEGASVPIEERLVPLLVLFAVAMAGIFLPAASIIQEKETRTIDAVLTTPIAVSEWMLAKGVLGFLLAFAIGSFTLLLNGGFSAQLLGHLAVLVVASFMCAQLGLLLGAGVNTMNAMFSIWKSGGIIIFAPAILFLFPAVPEWIARIFPSFYFLGPLYEMTVEGALFADVAMDLGIGALISIALTALVVPVSRRMETRLGLA